MEVPSGVSTGVADAHGPPARVERWVIAAASVVDRTPVSSVPQDPAGRRSQIELALSCASCGVGPTHPHANLPTHRAHPFLVVSWRVAMSKSDLARTGADRFQCCVLAMTFVIDGSGAAVSMHSWQVPAT